MGRFERTGTNGLLTIGIIVLLLLAWIGRVIVMLLFAAAIVAVPVAAIVDWISAKLKIRREIAIVLFLLATIILILLTLWIRGPRMRSVRLLRRSIPVTKRTVPLKARVAARR
ncbi:MAG TPA: hypothetical protein VNW54_03870 [Granulicella sp.]|nr:hypothetical protein [Granulicella sp.]